MATGKPIDESLHPIADSAAVTSADKPRFGFPITNSLETISSTRTDGTLGPAAR